MNIDIFIDPKTNVYDCISRSTDITNFFKLNYHQIIPKYYFLSNPDLRKLILSYSMGSGKSAAAVFLIAHFYSDIKKQKSLVKYNFIQEPDFTKKIYVIGNYATIDGLKKEILKPEFGIVDKKLIDEINKGLKSTNVITQQDAKRKQDKLMRKLEKILQFINFQALFNRCFPTLKTNNLLQKTDTLIDAFEKGKLEYREDVFESMRDSILVIDEFQRMYTSQYGINTYGFVIGIIMKFAQKYNIKFVFLSGTMMNTSPCELAYLNSILSEDKFLDTSKYITQEVLIDGTNGMSVLNKSKEPELINMIKDYVLYYNQKEHQSVEKQIVERLYKDNDVEMKLKFPQSKVDDSKMKMLVIKPSDSSLPIERYIGNTLIEVGGVKALNLYSIPLQGLQNEVYEQRLHEFSNVADDIEIDETTENNQREINPRDAVPDAKLRATITDGIFKGKILEPDTLCNYSGIALEMVKLTMNAIARNEKVVIYNDRITSFGLNQYVEILKQNGCCELGKPPLTNSKCKVCFKTYLEHGNDHPFKPIVLAVISGSIPITDRDRITAHYNKPNNLYGDSISVMFISSVAQTGVSFLNTNNLIILNRINTISRLSQIYGRIVRTHSHDALPENKRYVNIYTLTVEGQNESKPTVDCNYYSIRCILNQHINETMKKIKDSSVTDSIFNRSEGNARGNTPQELKLFREDLLNEMKNVIARIKISEDYPWEFGNLCSRICDKNFVVSYIDFSKIRNNYIQNELLNSNFIRYRKYVGLNLGKDVAEYLLCYPYTTSQIVNTKNRTKLTFKESELEQVKVEKNTLDGYYSDLKKLWTKIQANPNSSKFKNRCEIILSKLMKTPAQSVMEFGKEDFFWDLIYYINDEYYEDDNVNFVKNHSTKGRNRKKMKGMYYSDQIILKDGRIIPIDRKAKELVVSSNSDRIYSINCEQNSFTGNNWFLKVVILKLEINKFAETKLSVNNCFSYDVNTIKSDFDLDDELSKKNFCFDLIEEVCNKVIKNKEEDTFISPFDYVDKNLF